MARQPADLQHDERPVPSADVLRNHPYDPGFPSYHWAYGYGPGDVRIVVETDGQRRWTFRDPQDRVVREYLEQGGAWSHERELV